jgi:sporulation protein YabP
VFVLEEKVNLPHKIVIDERNTLNISGVLEVKSFNDETLVLNSVLGNITIKGEALKISSFNTKTGDLLANGKIYAVAYTTSESGGGFFSKMFR